MHLQVSDILLFYKFVSRFFASFQLLLLLLHMFDCGWLIFNLFLHRFYGSCLLLHLQDFGWLLFNLKFHRLDASCLLFHILNYGGLLLNLFLHLLDSCWLLLNFCLQWLNTSCLLLNSFNFLFYLFIHYSRLALNEIFLIGNFIFSLSDFCLENPNVTVVTVLLETVSYFDKVAIQAFKLNFTATFIQVCY